MNEKESTTMHYSLREILTDKRIYSQSSQILVQIKDDHDEKRKRILMISRNAFTFNNKDCFILNVSDLTSVKQVSALKTENNLLSLLAANVSHEMMTPLNCIIYFADILINFFRTDKVHEKQAKMIKHGANMMKFLVKDLLDRNLLE